MPESLDTIYDRIVEHMHSGRAGLAARMARRVLERHPTDHLFFAVLSAALGDQDKWEDARDMARKALDLEPSCAVAKWDYATASREVGAIDDAIGAFRALSRRSVQSITHATCNCYNTASWARAVINDSRLELARCYIIQGNERWSTYWLAQYLEHRPTRCRKGYTRRDMDYILVDAYSRAAERGMSSM